MIARNGCIESEVTLHKRVKADQNTSRRNNHTIAATAANKREAGTGEGGGGGGGTEITFDLLRRHAPVVAATLTIRKGGRREIGKHHTRTSHSSVVAPVGEYRGARGGGHK